MSCSERNATKRNRAIEEGKIKLFMSWEMINFANL